MNLIVCEREIEAIFWNRDSKSLVGTGHITKKFVYKRFLLLS